VQATGHAGSAGVKNSKWTQCRVFPKKLEPFLFVHGGKWGARVLDVFTTPFNAQGISYLVPLSLLILANYNLQIQLKTEKII